MSGIAQKDACFCKWKLKLQRFKENFIRTTIQMRVYIVSLLSSLTFHADVRSAGDLATLPISKKSRDSANQAQAKNCVAPCLHLNLDSWQ